MNLSIRPLAAVAAVAVLALAGPALAGDSEPTEAPAPTPAPAATQVTEEPDVPQPVTEDEAVHEIVACQDIEAAPADGDGDSIQAAPECAFEVEECSPVDGGIETAKTMTDERGEVRAYAVECVDVTGVPGP